MLTLFERNMISIIRASLGEESPVVSEEFDYKKAYEVAQNMQIVPLVYYGLEKVPNAFEKVETKKFLKSTISYSYFCECQDKEYDVVLDAFDREGVDYMKLKGVLLKRLYPRTEMRLMSDADVLIRCEQYAKIKEIMLALGYSENLESDHEYVFSKENFTIELHKRLIPSYNKDYFKYFGDGWRLAKQSKAKPNEYEMSCEDEFIYLFTHFAKHYRDAGIGVKHLTDFYVFLKANELDWQYVSSELERLQLLDFWKTIKTTLEVWFGDKVCDEKSAYVTHKIFGGSVYGTYEAHVLSSGAKMSKNAKKVRRKSLFKSIFPPCSVINQRFKFLRKLPILLPFAWVLNWITIIFNPKRIARRKKELDAQSMQNIQAYNDELSYVGLSFNFE